MEVEGASGTIVRLGSNPINAASTFHYQHFLGLLILWDISTGKRPIPSEIMEQFKKHSPKKSPGFDQYLSEIRSFDYGKDHSQSLVPADLGAFVNVWQLQKHVLTGDNNSQKVEEEIVVSPPPDRTRRQTRLREEYLKTPSGGTRSQKVSD